MQPDIVIIEQKLIVHSANSAINTPVQAAQRLLVKVIEYDEVPPTQRSVSIQYTCKNAKVVSQQLPSTAVVLMLLGTKLTDVIRNYILTRIQPHCCDFC